MLESLPPVGVTTLIGERGLGVCTRGLLLLPSRVPGWGHSHHVLGRYGSPISIPGARSQAEAPGLSGLPGMGFCGDRLIVNSIKLCF